MMYTDLTRGMDGKAIAISARVTDIQLEHFDASMEFVDIELPRHSARVYHANVQYRPCCHTDVLEEFRCLRYFSILNCLSFHTLKPIMPAVDVPLDAAKNCSPLRHFAPKNSILLRA